MLLSLLPRLGLHFDHLGEGDVGTFVVIELRLVVRVDEHTDDGGSVDHNVLVRVGVRFRLVVVRDADGVRADLGELGERITVVERLIVALSLPNLALVVVAVVLSVLGTFPR